VKCVGTFRGVCSFETAKRFTKNSIYHAVNDSWAIEHRTPRERESPSAVSGRHVDSVETDRWFGVGAC
jgi:hypothetical protein